MVLHVHQLFLRRSILGSSLSGNTRCVNVSLGLISLCLRTISISTSLQQAQYFVQHRHLGDFCVHINRSRCIASSHRISLTFIGHRLCTRFSRNCIWVRWISSIDITAFFASVRESLCFGVSVVLNWSVRVFDLFVLRNGAFAPFYVDDVVLLVQTVDNFSNLQILVLCVIQ
ncbi:hypothetical protein D3C80_1429070 [compost metagenome]